MEIRKSSSLTLIIGSRSGFVWEVLCIHLTYWGILFVHVEISWCWRGLFHLLSFYFLFNHRLWYFNYRFWFLHHWLWFFDQWFCFFNHRFRLLDDRLRFWRGIGILKSTARYTVAHFLDAEHFNRWIFRLVEIGND